MDGANDNDNYEGELSMEVTRFQDDVSDFKAKCVVCNNIVEVNFKAILKDDDVDEDEDNSESYLRNKNKKRVRRMKNYLSLFCKLSDLNEDETFGDLFTSETGGNVSVSNEENPTSPQCCSTCFTLLIKIWKMQKIIKNSQDVQQVDIKRLTELLFDNPSHVLANWRRGVIESAEDRGIIPSSLNQPLNSSPEGSSPRSSKRHTKLKAIEPANNLIADDTTEEIKSEHDTDCEYSLMTEDEYFHPDEVTDFENIDDEDANDEINSNSNGKRPPNFSFEENEVMLKLIRENSHVLFGAKRTAKNIQAKNALLQKMKHAVNKVSGNRRPTYQIINKLNYLRKRVDLENVEKSSKNVASHSKMQKSSVTVPFTHQEVQVLSKLMPDYITAVGNRQGNGDVITKIANSVNQVGGMSRTKKQVLKKLMNMRTRSRKTGSANNPKFHQESLDSENVDKLLPVPKLVLVTPSDETHDDPPKNKSVRRPQARVKVKGQHKCTQCDKQFDSAISLQKHSVTHLPKSLRPSFDCLKCDQKFLSKKAVDKHLISVHNHAPAYWPKSKVKYLKCHICPKSFYWYNKTRFKSHVQSHAGVNRPRPYACDICGKQFFDKCTLQKHANVHSSERRYECEVCDEKFKYPSNLSSHRKTCHKDVFSTPDIIGPTIAYPCEFCEKVFPFPSRLTKHLTVCKVRKGMQSN